MNKEKSVLEKIRLFVKKEPRYHPNEVRVILALERAIARLLFSPELRDHLIFKGGFVLLKEYQSARFTRDADALAVSISKKKLCEKVCMALGQDLDDGFWYGDVRYEELSEQGEYGAFRFDCAFQIGKPDLKKIHKLSRIHIDVSFEDNLHLLSDHHAMSSLLETEESVSWRVYPIEFIVAEKLQTFIDRGSENSRAKDVYDLIHLFPKCRDQNLLVKAVKKTFENRKTPLPVSFVKEAQNFEKTLLSMSWLGMKTFENKTDFETAWKILIKILKNFDTEITNKQE